MCVCLGVVCQVCHSVFDCCTDPVCCVWWVSSRRIWLVARVSATSKKLWKGWLIRYGVIWNMFWQNWSLAMPWSALTRSVNDCVFVSVCMCVVCEISDTSFYKSYFIFGEEEDCHKSWCPAKSNIMVWDFVLFRFLLCYFVSYYFPPCPSPLSTHSSSHN